MDKDPMTPDTITPPAERAVEIRAKEIYETWADHPGYVPWSSGGNSEMQDKARFMAAKELGSGFAPYQIRGSDTTQPTFTQEFADVMSKMTFRGTQPSETETPRTDALIYEEACGFEVSWEEEYRTLERELAEARKDASEWKAGQRKALEICDRQHAELAQKDALIGRLVGALTELRNAPWLSLPGRAGDIVEEALALVEGGESE